jgi:hypothetical protein
VHGAPRRFQSDQGDQLVAASKKLATWNWASVDKLCSQRGATWRLVPTGGQHYNAGRVSNWFDEAVPGPVVGG